MFLNIAAVIGLVKSELSDVDVVSDAKIKSAIDKALGEMALRVKGKGLFETYEETITAGDREVTLKGSQNTLNGIMALKIGNSTDQRVLIYKDRQDFLDNWDDPDASPGKPLYYTVINIDDGFPVVKFDGPTDTSYTLVVYNYVSATQQNMTYQYSVIALVDGATARFYGITSSKGAPYHASFKELCALTRSKETFVPDKSNTIPISQEDRGIRATLGGIRGRRT